MSKVYSPAPSGVAERVAHLIKVFHKDLQDAGVKIDLLSVADDDPEVEHALKVRGVPAYACCKAIEIKGRTMGRGDVEIIIDESKYLTVPDATKDAILDHEIEHIELQLGKKGRVKLDCCRRPKIKMRQHDIDVGWFESIAKRHGKASIECHQANQVFLNHTQTFFAFVGEAQKSLPSVDSVMERVISETIAGRGTEGFERLAKNEDTTVTLCAGSKSVTIDKDGIRSGKTP